MIIGNTKDKYIKSICEEAMKSSVYQALPQIKDLYVYGISEDRNVSVAISSDGFVGAKELINFINISIGYSIHDACYWDLGSVYNNQVIGLGYGMRKTKKKECVALVLLAYVALYNAINFE